MRKAAGIILIISGIVGLVGVVMSLSTSNIYIELLDYLHLILWRIGSGAFLIVGGVFCLRRKYWGACLAAALFAVGFIGIPSTIDYFRYVATHKLGPLSDGPISMTWGIWIVLLGAVISTIFIIRRKKEWSEIRD
jgi:hypothetical protein